jgi:hypothetical protein
MKYETILMELFLRCLEIGLLEIISKKTLSLGVLNFLLQNIGLVSIQGKLQYLFLNEMMMLLLMKNQLVYGKELECQKIGLVIFQNQRIGGDLLVRHDHVDLILRYFIG